MLPRDGGVVVGTGLCGQPGSDAGLCWASEAMITMVAVAIVVFICMYLIVFVYMQYGIVKNRPWNNVLYVHFSPPKNPVLVT